MLRQALFCALALILLTEHVEVVAVDRKCVKFCGSVFGRSRNAWRKSMKCLQDAKSNAGLCYTCGPKSAGGYTGLCKAGTPHALCCPAETPTCCGKKHCVDTDSDPNNCGRCKHKCESGECVDGTCKFEICEGKTCPMGQVLDPYSCTCVCRSGEPLCGTTCCRFNEECIDDECKRIEVCDGKTCGPREYLDEDECECVCRSGNEHCGEECCRNNQVCNEDTDTCETPRCPNCGPGEVQVGEYPDCFCACRSGNERCGEVCCKNNEECNDEDECEVPGECEDLVCGPGEEPVFDRETEECTCQCTIDGQCAGLCQYCPHGGSPNAYFNWEGCTNSDFNGQPCVPCRAPKVKCENANIHFCCIQNDDTCDTDGAFPTCVDT